MVPPEVSGGFFCRTLSTATKDNEGQVRREASHFLLTWLLYHHQLTALTTAGQAESVET